MRRIIRLFIPSGNHYRAGYRIKIGLICTLTKDQALISISTIQEFPSQDALLSVIIGFIILTFKHQTTIINLNLNLGHNSYHLIHLLFNSKFNIAQHSSVWTASGQFSRQRFLVFWILGSVYWKLKFSERLNVFDNCIEQLVQFSDHLILVFWTSYFSFLNYLFRFLIILF